MTRYILTSLAILALSASSDHRVRAAAQDQDSNRLPNIIFILADDLGYGDLGCYGQRQIATPRIDQLARQGLRFTQAYAGGCVCTPSRSCLMTGLHGGHTPARDNVPHYHTYLQDEDVTVAEVLHEAGYRCGGVGKWSLGDAGTVGRATSQGFDTWLGYLNQDHAHFYYTEYLDDDEGRLELTGNSQSHEHYSHDLLVERALGFIRESQDEPFFLYAAFTVPHFGNRSEDATRLPVPSDEPYADRPWDQQAKNYAAMITRLDGDVGRIVDLVDSLGLSDNTLIIFTSDHGPWAELHNPFNSTGPLRAKRDVYEGGLRVPFIARWPGHVPQNKTSDEVVAFWDMLPTLAELAGAAPPEHIDGISVVEALRGGRVMTPRKYLYWDYGHNREVYHQAVRLGDYKGIRHGVGGPVELYDLSSDVGESNNIAAAHPDVVQKIEQIMITAVTPSPRYEIGKLYTGEPIWKPGQR